VANKAASTTAQIQALVDAIKIIGISAQSRSIAENSANGANVGAVLETTGSPTGFSITSGNTNDAFAISNSGQITVATTGELDFETTTSYTLAVEITKADTDSQSANITIDVTNFILFGTQKWSASNVSFVPTLNNTLDTDYWTDSSDGYLYTWDAAMNVCPSGWRLPSDDDWKVLEGYIGLSLANQESSNNWRGTDEGAALKEGGSSGFEGPIGSWWSSTQNSGGAKAYIRALRTTDDKIGRILHNFTTQRSVRCLKN
jgi:uncharacterized protein (TIGR02145 family)